MKRREFITLLGGATATWPLAARAQPAVPVIGLLNSTTLEAQVERLAAFQQGLKKEAGFVAGQNVTIEYRSAEGLTDQLSILARDLVRRQVSVMVATSTASAVAAKRATETLPIVFLTGGDPVELGLIASLNRPGGNATGVSFLVNKLVAKRMELLSELAPGASTLGMLVDPNNPNAESDTNDAQVAADALGRKLLVVKAATQSELDAAFATLAQKQVATLFVAANVNFVAWRAQIIALAMRHGIAASYTTREFVMAGGLMSYGPDQAEVFRQIGMYAGRILKGAKPADMPVMQSAKFEFIINLRTAKAQALTIPPALLALADEVIGLLSGTDQEASQLDGIWRGLDEAGFVEGRNVAMEYRWAEGQLDRLPALAADLVRRQVAVIVAIQSAAAPLAAKTATATIPIVFSIGGDAVKLGLVSSLNRPGGNVTGTSFLYNTLAPKRLELLHELVPNAAVVGLLVNPKNPASQSETADLQTAARALGLRIVVQNATSDHDIDAAFAGFIQQRVDALTFAADAVFNKHRDQLIALAARHAVPAMYFAREFTAAGGLMSYGGDITNAYRLAGVYAGRILKGEKPLDLPVQLAVKVEFVINLKTAKTLGLEVPPMLLTRADEVIE